MSPVAAYAAEACRLYILVVLGAALLGKARAVDALRDTVVSLSGLGDRGAAVAARAVIGVEAATLVAVIVEPAAGMVGAMVLFALFWAVILFALVRRPAVVCNCFGGGARPISRLDLVRNLAMTGACAFFLLSPRPPALAPSGWLLLLGVGIIAFLISTHLDEIIAPAR